MTGQGRGDFAEFNQRFIYSRFTKKGGIALSIEGLDFLTNKGEPNPTMKVRMCKTDLAQERGSRVTGVVETFIPLPAFLRLCHGVLSGEYDAQWERKAKGNEPFFLYRSGSNQSGPVAKSFSLVPAKPIPGMEGHAYAFASSAIPGTQVGGIIQPQPGAQPISSIFTPMQMDDLQEFCLIGQSYAQQYIQMDLAGRLESVRAQRANYVAEREGPA